MTKASRVERVRPLRCLSRWKSVGKINFHLTNRMKFTLFQRYLSCTHRVLDRGFSTRLQNQTHAHHHQTPYGSWCPCSKLMADDATPGFISQSCHTHLTRYLRDLLTHLAGWLAGWCVAFQVDAICSPWPTTAMRWSTHAWKIDIKCVHGSAEDTQNGNPEGSFQR